MESFTYNNIEIVFWSVTGEILSSDKYSETHVSSSGGGGYVGQYGGHVSAPQVHSSVVTNHEFWIKTNEGIEEAIRLKGYDIPLRSGQKITIISAREKGSKSGWYSILVNHNAQKHWVLNNADSLFNLTKNTMISGSTVLIDFLITGGIFIGTIYGCLATGWGEGGLNLLLAIFITGGYIVFRMKRYVSIISEGVEKLDAYLEDIAQKSYKNT